MQRREGYDGMQRRRDMAVSRWRRNDGMQRREGEGSLPVRDMMMKKKKKTRRDGWGYSKP